MADSGLALWSPSPRGSTGRSDPTAQPDGQSSAVRTGGVCGPNRFLAIAFFDRGRSPVSDPTAGTDPVLRVRANHKDLRDRMENSLALERTGNFAECLHDNADRVGKDHDRIASRRCKATGNPDHLAHVARNGGSPTSLVRMESERHSGNQVADRHSLPHPGLPFYPSRPSPYCKR